MKLSARQVETLQPREKTFRLFDGKGLYLEVPPNGNKRWRFKYRFHYKEKRISLGVYPFTSLATAREELESARALLAQGIDASEARKAEKARFAEEQARISAIEQAQQQGSRVRIVADLENTVEIWKGRRVLILSQEEARQVSILLQRLTIQKAEP